MVKICSLIYPSDNESKYKEYFEKYPYELHDFQKWSIEAIVTGNHALVCCPTGTGKTTTLYTFLKKIHNPKVKIVTMVLLATAIVFLFVFL